MSTGTTVRSVADALQDAASWRSDEEARHQGQVAEVEHGAVSAGDEAPSRPNLFGAFAFAGGSSRGRRL